MWLPKRKRRFYLGKSCHCLAARDFHRLTRFSVFRVLFDSWMSKNPLCLVGLQIGLTAIDVAVSNIAITTTELRIKKKKKKNFRLQLEFLFTILLDSWASSSGSSRPSPLLVVVVFPVVVA